MNRCTARVRESSSQGTGNKPFEVGGEKPKNDNTVKQDSGQASVITLDILVLGSVKTRSRCDKLTDTGYQQGTLA
jgi:hypothetical protein